MTTNGIFRPFALVDGRAVASWGLAGETLTIRPLEPVADDDLEALIGEATAVGAYLRLGSTPAVVVGPRS